MHFKWVPVTGLASTLPNEFNWIIVVVILIMNVVAVAFAVELIINNKFVSL
jgi:hypothetical protein